MSWSIYKHEGSDGKGSLVSPEQLGAAQEHKIVLDIMPPNKVDGDPLATIVGFMKEAFSYSVKADYNNILAWNDPMDSVFFKAAADIVQRNTSFYSGYGSKRIFNPSKSYVSLNLKFRAYDDPDVIARCDLLSKCCLPFINRNNFMLTGNAVEIAGKIVSESANVLASTGKAIYDDGLGAGVVNVTKAFLDQFSTKMPPHLRVSLGSYFKKSEMVLTSCDFTFSKEFTRKDGNKYPTYVDFDLGVESLYSSLAMSLSTSEADNQQNQIFGPGFMVDSAKGKRVTIDEKTDVAENYVGKNEIKTTTDAFGRSYELAITP